MQTKYRFMLEEGIGRNELISKEVYFEWMMGKFLELDKSGGWRTLWIHWMPQSYSFLNG